MTSHEPEIAGRIRACRLCAADFALTATRHEPRPVVWFRTGARILIVGQAPGLRVHESGVPFDDRSGDRLRDWLGMTRDEFYDRDRVAMVPMAFCFPGYDAAGSDLPPPPICAATWRRRALAALAGARLTLLIGGHAIAWHLPGRRSVRDSVAAWREAPPGLLPLPHPSWRNTAWLRRNPWFETELLPVLRARVAALLSPQEDPAR